LTYQKYIPKALELEKRWQRCKPL